MTHIVICEIDSQIKNKEQNSKNYLLYLNTIFQKSVCVMNEKIYQKTLIDIHAS